MLTTAEKIAAAHRTGAKASKACPAGPDQPFTCHTLGCRTSALGPPEPVLALVPNTAPADELRAELVALLGRAYAQGSYPAKAGTMLAGVEAVLMRFCGVSAADLAALEARTVGGGAA